MSDSAKVGKHLGPLKKLVGRYKTPCLSFPVIAFDCSGYDYSLVERMIHSVLKAYGKHLDREHFSTGMCGMFKEIMSSFFTVGESNCTSPEKSFVSDVDNWFASFVSTLVYTKNVSDVIDIKDVYKLYVQHKLTNEEPIISFKDFKINHPNVANKELVGFVIKKEEIQTLERKSIPFMRFFDEDITITNNRTDYISLLQLYKHYDAWKREKRILDNVKNKKLFGQQILKDLDLTIDKCNITGKCYGNMAVFGVKYKTNESNISLLG